MAAGIVLSKRLLSPGVVVLTHPSGARSIVEYEPGTLCEIRNDPDLAAVLVQAAAPPAPAPAPVAPRPVVPPRAPVPARAVAGPVRTVSFQEAIASHAAATGAPVPQVDPNAGRQVLGSIFEAAQQGAEHAAIGAELGELAEAAAELDATTDEPTAAEGSNPGADGAP